MTEDATPAVDETAYDHAGAPGDAAPELVDPAAHAGGDLLADPDRDARTDERPDAPSAN